jgi:hypothetical protein
MVVKLYLIPFSQVGPPNPDGQTQPPRTSSKIPPFTQVTSEGTKKMKKKNSHISAFAPCTYTARKLSEPRKTVLVFYTSTSTYPK